MAEVDEVFDLDAVVAEQRAKRRRFPFKWGGRQWSLDNAMSLDMSLLEQADAGDVEAIMDALRKGLGEQYEKFTEVGLELGALVPLFERWVADAGSKPGESSASSTSSGSTERPSKPTSRGTTRSASGKRSSVPRSSGTPRANS